MVIVSLLWVAVELEFFLYNTSMGRWILRDTIFFENLLRGQEEGLMVDLRREGFEPEPDIMKKTIGLILAVFAVGTMVGVAGEAKVATLKLTVDGMRCAGCAGSITEKLEDREDVQEVYVHLDSKLVAVGLEDGVEVSDDDAKAMLKDVGYQVTKVERSPESLEVVRAEAEKAES